MILLRKLEKPSILLDKEHEWTKQLMSHYNIEQTIPKNSSQKYGHREIKERLLEETNHKCAYCESKITAIDYGDIEHIEPKSKVPSRTYDWENLTLSCRKCNLNKKDYYNPNMPLINPYLNNPEDEIVFLGPIISARTERARLTVKLLKLDRVELFESRVNHIKNIQPLIDLYVDEDDDILKEMVYRDILRFTENTQEYSAMMKSVVATIDGYSLASTS